MKREKEIRELAQKIDHAVLNPVDGSKEVIEACKMAIDYEIASVCVKPSYVNLAASQLKDSNVVVCTVIGFPHGGTTSSIKLAEAKEAINSGAKEVDMVINIAKLKEGDYEFLRDEIKLISDAVHSLRAILKVIIETALLNDNEKISACMICGESGADFVKTSTGFAQGGASIDDIKLMKTILPERIKIKASGGIKSFEQAKTFISAGCSRIGTSRTEHILSSKESTGGC